MCSSFLFRTNLMMFRNADTNAQPVRKVMATMPIGSSLLPKMPVSFGRVFYFALISLCVFGCELKRSPSWITLSGKEEAEIFFGDKIHLEVIPRDGKAQIFYFVNIDDLARGLTLRPYETQHGIAKGFETYLAKDQENDMESHTILSDIIAIPEANKGNFLSPRIPNIRTRLSTDQRFQLDLISGQAYTIILNPSGRYDRAPVFLRSSPENKSEELSFVNGEN